MRIFVIVVLGFLLCAGVQMYAMYYLGYLNPPEPICCPSENLCPIPDHTKNFKLTNEQMVSDLRGRSLKCILTNEIWVFDASKQTVLESLQVKGVEDGVMVWAKVTSSQIPGKRTDTLKRRNNHITGIVKLRYERVKEDWVLSNLTNLSVAVYEFVKTEEDNSNQ